MFTGIVEEVGRIKSVEPKHLTIAASKVMDDLKVSDSINVNGTCLTVTSRDDSGFSVDVVPETLRRTNLGTLKEGSPVNLERPLAVNDRFGGHIVQGHVDGTATVESITDDSEALLIKFQAPPSVMRYVVEKGFITVDGTSLTVVNCGIDSFTVTIIPFTRDNTVFIGRKVGDTVNIETDIIAKYVERLSGGARVPIDIIDEL
ncbi:MAG: riboflavin synthase [Chloroflexi bacterium]|nr:riboflavin synthase [Chloroflexota bacterium]